MKRKPRIYIAGPITKGNRETNVYRGIHMGDAMLKLGFAPFIPHYSHYHNVMMGVRQPSYEDWMAMDFTWILACDVLFRLSGPSSGADREVRFARKHGIPVFFEGKVGEFDRLLKWKTKFMQRHSGTKKKVTQ